MIVQFFIHLHAEFHSQWSITQPAGMQSKAAIKQTQGQALLQKKSFKVVYI